MTTTNLSVINQALRLLGDQPIDDYPETSPTERGDKITEVFETVRDDTLIEHPWNFATVRTILRSYVTPEDTLTPGATTGTAVTFTAGSSGTFYAENALDVGKILIEVNGPGRAEIVANPDTQPVATLTPGALTGIGVTFTASAAVFASGDVGKLLRDNDLGSLATITAFTDSSNVVATILVDFSTLAPIASGVWSLVETDNVTADITTDWTSTDPLAAGEWILENVPPDWGYAHSLTVPDDLLRLWRVGDDEHEPRDRYQREGDYIVSDVSDLRCRYIAKITDPSKWPSYFVRALVYHLAAVLSDDVTGKGDRVTKYWDLYQAMIRRARTRDAMEGSAERIFPSDLVTVRFGRGGRSGIVGPRLP